MHLITPLVCGVQNAGNGSAAVFRRGTTTPAGLYSSFEGDAFASSSLDSNDRVILDSYGRAEVYVDEVCDVSVYDADGTLQISFTAGAAASAVEVRSPSFTGSAYDGSGSAAGRPTTLQAVLDRWVTERDAVDWSIDAGEAQPFFVVTSDAYGAEGDGTTDDTVAVTAAIAAAETAGGGIVYFPPGTYRLTSAVEIPASGNNIRLLGAGAESTAIKIEQAGANLFTLESLAYLVIEGFTLSAGTVNNTAALISMSTTGGIRAFCTLRDCTIGNDACDGNLIEADDVCVIRVERCDVTTGSASSSFIYASGAGGTIVVVDSTITPSSASPHTSDGLIYGDDIRARDCVFDPGGVTSGTLKFLVWNTGTDDMLGKVTGCHFDRPIGSVDVVCMDLAEPGNNSMFYEDNNRFGDGSLNPETSPSMTAYEYGGIVEKGVHLGTRETRVYVVTDNSATIDIPTDQYGVIIVKSTNTNVELDGHRPPEGAKGWVFFYHPSGGAGTAELGQHFFGDSTATTANTSTHAWQYVTLNLSGTTRMVVTVDAHDCGLGA